MHPRFGFVVCLAPFLGAVFLTNASSAQTLSRAFRLVVGTALRYDGTSQYRIAQAGAEPFVVDLEWRLQLFVLEHDDDRAVCAIVASRRKAGTTDAYRTASLCFAELRRKDGTLRLLSEPGANDTSFLEQLLPQVVVPGSKERTQSYAIDVTQFGLQQADTTVLVHAKRQRVDGAAASQWMSTTFTLEADEPVTVQSGDTSMNVVTFQREFVIDEKAGRLVSTHSSTKVLVHGTEQTRTSSFQLFSMRLATAGTSRAGRTSSRSAIVTLGPSMISKRSLSRVLKSRCSPRTWAKR